MARNILILGASYGSLLGTKLLMAGHNVTLVCRRKTADLINREGTEVRIKLRDELSHRSIFSRDLPGKLDAVTPADVNVSRYDLVGLAMQEPQYTNHTIRVLMIKIAEAKLPCLSIMNMPPLPYLKRIPSLAEMDLEEAYTNASVWERFKPGLVSLCSPDPQAFRPPEEAANVLHVGLATNFKAAAFADEAHNKVLRELEADIDAVKLDGQDVPVKLKVFDSPFVPLAKWSMLLTGNYRCITLQEPQSIRDAVHGDLKLSQSIYEHVDAVARRLGADPKDQVPFEKYAKAAESLLKPSSAARAVAAGAPFIERVDLLVKLISHQLGAPSAEIDRTVQIVDQKLNEKIVEGGSGGLSRPYSLPPARRRHTHHSFERTAERGFGLVANLGGDCCHVHAPAIQHFRSDLHSPSGEILHWRHAEKLNEPLRKNASRCPALPCEAFDRPTEGWSRVNQRERPAHGRIAQARQPTGLLRRQRLDVTPHHVDEHQFAELRQHAFAAGAFVGNFGHREVDELAEPAGIVAARVAGFQHRRQRFDQRIERTGIASEIATYQPGGNIAAVRKVDMQWKTARVGHVEEIGGRRRCPHAGGARHDMRIGVGEHHDFAGFERNCLPVDKAGVAAARSHHVIRNQMVCSRQHPRQDQVPRRRMD
jgi:hypothetical protein